MLQIPINGFQCTRWILISSNTCYFCEEKAQKQDDETVTIGVTQNRRNQDGSDVVVDINAEDIFVIITLQSA